MPAPARFPVAILARCHAGCVLPAASYTMRLSIRAKQVLGVTALIGLVVVGLSVHGLAQLARVRLEETRARGKLLCLCSRNEEADVRAVFTRHPDMTLTLADITAHRIGWQPKAHYLRELSDELGLALDSFVFVDDDALEPEATVADLTVRVNDPALAPTQQVVLQAQIDAATQRFQGLFERRQDLLVDISLKRGNAELVQAAVVPATPASPQPARTDVDVAGDHRRRGARSGRVQAALGEQGVESSFRPARRLEVAHREVAHHVDVNRTPSTGDPFRPEDYADASEPRGSSTAAWMRSASSMTVMSRCRVCM